MKLQDEARLVLEAIVNGDKEALKQFINGNGEIVIGNQTKVQEFLEQE